MKVIFSIAPAPWKVCVTMVSRVIVTDFKEPNGLAVHYTNVKDKVALKLPVKYLAFISEILTQCPTKLHRCNRIGSSG